MKIFYELLSHVSFSFLNFVRKFIFTFIVIKSHCRVFTCRDHNRPERLSPSKITLHYDAAHSTRMSFS
jgi:hypothetical protein